MTKLTVIALALASLMGCAPSPSTSEPTPVKPTQAPSTHENAVAQIIIKFKPSYNDGSKPLTTSQLAQLSQVANTPLSYVRAMSGDAHIIATIQPIPLAQAEALSGRLSAQPFVEYAEPDRIMRIQ